MYFKENLKKLRKEQNLSQEQLAEILNISRQAVSKWESGKTYPDIENLILLRELFNVTLDDLIINENINNCDTVRNLDMIIDRIEDNSKDEEDKNEKYDREDDDDLSTNLMMGGMIIGIAIGFITDNFQWGMVGCFLGMGLGYIIEYIMKKIIKK